MEKSLVAQKSNHKAHNLLKAKRVKASLVLLLAPHPVGYTLVHSNVTPMGIVLQWPTPATLQALMPGISRLIQVPGYLLPIARLQ